MDQKGDDFPSIDISTEDSELVEVNIPEAPTEGIEEEPEDAMDVEEQVPVEAEDIPQEEPKKKKKPKRKPMDKKKMKKTLFMVGIILLASIGGIMAVRLVNLSVSNVDLYIEDQPDFQRVMILLTVETDTIMSRSFTDTITVQIDGPGQPIYMDLDVDHGDALDYIDYEDFYWDNGEYVFSVSIEGMGSQDSVSIAHTAHYISYVPNPQDSENREELYVTFELWKSEIEAGNLWKSVKGHGTIDIYNGTLDEYQDSDPELESIDFYISGIAYGRDMNMDDQYGGGYEFIIPYSDFAIYDPVEEVYFNNYTVKITFTNTFPETNPVTIDSHKGFVIDY